MLNHPKSSHFYRWLAILLLFSLLAAMFPLGIAAAADVKCARYYEANKNSTLSKIASAFGLNAGQIAYANNLKKPYTIYVGQRLCIPEKTENKTPKSINGVSGTTKAAYFVAGITSDGQVLVHPYSYPNTTVKIKVRTDGGSPGKWYKLGTLYIGSSGNGKTYTYKMPADLKGTRNVQICMKDVTTSYLQCVKPLGQ